jgi:hypothetical protein
MSNPFDSKLRNPTLRKIANVVIVVEVVKISGLWLWFFAHLVL